MYTIKNNTIRISVRNLVEFIFCSGDIDNRKSGVSDSKLMQEGIRIHKKIQKSMGPLYKAEVPLRYETTVEHQESYVIILEGRADGIISDFDIDEVGNKVSITDVIIDEIKSTQADLKNITEPIYVHKAQAMCYAYMFMCDNHLDSIHVQLTYCNIENELVKTFQEQYSNKELSEWFFNLLEKFQRWTDFLFTSKRIRQQTIQDLEFPFHYREGQKELATNVYRTIARERNLFIQAPTGVGKTISTVFPAVKAIGQEQGDKLFYLTAKTITRTVAEDTFELLRNNNLYFRTVTITAKDKVCIIEERDCNPVACSCAKGHFDRVNEAVYDLVTNELNINRDKIVEYALKHNVCPFEMSLDVTYWCDGIICDYNYVFDPNVRLKRYFADGSKGEYLFLIDEAHNLVERARNMYSAKLSKESILDLKKILKDTDKKLVNYLEKANKELLELKRECAHYQLIESSSFFVMSLERIFFQLQKFFDEHPKFEYMEKVSEFYLNLRHFLNMYEIMDEKYVVYTEHTEDGHFWIHLFCIDPSANIRNCIDQGKSAIFFSATLLPIQYYKEMITGDLEDYAIYAESPFSEGNKSLLISSDISSRYTRRNISEYQRICEYIHIIMNAHAGKYLVFFPSYQYMENVYSELVKFNLKMDGCHYKIIKQNSMMNERDREEFLANFSNSDTSGSQEDEHLRLLNYESNVVGFCVIGGIFSEGIDLKYDSLIGSIIIGTGLPMICNEREILKYYFDCKQKSGYDYAYVFPGMNKVMQAAGRVIRTDEDRGVIALLDDRFLNPDYQKLFPREWANFHVVNKNTVNELVMDFWRDYK